MTLFSCNLKINKVFYLKPNFAGIQEGLIVFDTYRKVLVIISFVFCLSPSVFAYSGGTGEPNNPYQIATVSDWNDLMHTPSDWNKYFIMTADIDLQGIALTPVGNDYYNSFAGVFDGNGHIIRNVKINMPNSEFVGLFGYLGYRSRICNLGVRDVNITGYSLVGGLVGFNYMSPISNCYSTGAISGSNYVGGLVGYNGPGDISNCYSAGAVSGSSSSDSVGGLIGRSYGSINQCYSTGMVSGFQYVGGLVGYDGRDSIGNCYSTGSVSGSQYVGGLVGHKDGGGVSDCYSTGAVSGISYVGGLMGHNYLGTITACFWDVNTSGWSTSAGGEGKTTAEMQTLSTFTSAGWDFSYTDGDEADWFIQIDEYPILTWQISPADIYTDGRNNFRDFAVFAQYWMRNDCRVYNNHCDWADLNFDGSVNYDDLIELMSYWLETGIY
jgi:hypothetical protein